MPGARGHSIQPKFAPICSNATGWTLCDGPIHEEPVQGSERGPRWWLCKEAGALFRRSNEGVSSEALTSDRYGGRAMIAFVSSIQFQGHRLYPGLSLSLDRKKHFKRLKQACGKTTIPAWLTFYAFLKHQHSQTPNTPCSTVSLALEQALTDILARESASWKTLCTQSRPELILLRVGMRKPLNHVIFLIRSAAVLRS